jgi:hypothetical protein
MVNKLPPSVILNHKTMAKKQMQEELLSGAQWNYEGLVVSGVKQQTRDTPDKTWVVGLGSI